jgi:hypothetical protein
VGIFPADLVPLVDLVSLADLPAVPPKLGGPRTPTIATIPMQTKNLIIQR